LVYPEATLNPGIQPSRKEEATSSSAFKVSCTCKRDVSPDARAVCPGPQAPP
jgi:hypothetical protein